VLERSGALSVTHQDAGEQPVLEPEPGEVRLWPRTHTTALFDADAPTELIELALRQHLGDDLVQASSWRTLADREWEREWLVDFAPMRFGQRLWIEPSGCVVDAPEAVIVSLDPGLAFGTGTHPTTALCLEHLDARPPVGHRVLDFGCGSGVLAIAALKLGASSAIGVDIDPQALHAAADNAERNQVGDRLTLAPPVALPEGEQYDTVLANILSGPLIDLAPQLAAALAPGGQLLLSGILEPQVEAVRTAYAELDATPEVVLREGWACIRLVARS
jgi:ribosomal protein L11 methyltransferase